MRLLRPPSRAHTRMAAKVGLVALVCLVSFGWLLGQVSNWSPLSDRVRYEAVLPDATGLHPDDTVRVAGAEVGRVRDISIERGLAVVAFDVDRDLELPTDTEVGVRWRNLTGQRFLYLYPGTERATVDPGIRFELERARETVELADLLDALGPVLSAIDVGNLNDVVAALEEGLGEDGSRTRQLLADAAVVADSVGELDSHVATVIEEFDRGLRILAERDGDLDRLIRDVGAVSGTLAENDQLLVQLVTDLESLLEEADRAVSGSREDLDDIIEGLATVAATVAAHSDELRSTLETSPAGLAMYHEISATGQWFTLGGVVVCGPGPGCYTEDPGFGGFLVAPVPGGSGSEPARAGSSALSAFFSAPREAVAR